MPDSWLAEALKMIQDTMKQYINDDIDNGHAEIDLMDGYVVSHSIDDSYTQALTSKIKLGTICTT